MYVKKKNSNGVYQKMDRWDKKNIITHLELEISHLCRSEFLAGESCDLGRNDGGMAWGWGGEEESSEYVGGSRYLLFSGK